MVVIQVSATAQVENVARFEQVLRQVVEETRAGVGCLRYEWFRVPIATERSSFTVSSNPRTRSLSIGEALS
jgi:quinol monooxygenase YgiN